MNGANFVKLAPFLLYKLRIVKPQILLKFSPFTTQPASLSGKKKAPLFNRPPTTANT